MPNYCENNLMCVNKTCKKLHYKSIDERMIFSQIVEEHKTTLLNIPVETVNPKSWTCRYHLLCFEANCNNKHSGFALEARKVVKKAFNKHTKQQKIVKEIEDLKTIAPVSWADTC